MADLISLPRAVQNSTLAGLAAANPGYLASLISAASDALRRACGRDFTPGSYTEYHSGGIYVREPLRLRQFPVTEITRVAAIPLAALLVQNTDSVTHQRATLETTPSSVRLVSIASAVLTTTDLLFSTYATVASLASAINVLGNGWSATIRNDFANWPSADFKSLQGAVSALLGGHELEIYRESVQPLSTWPWLTGDGDSGCQGAGWRLDEETGEMFGRFPRGQLNLRIDYRAGFAAVPQPIQEACVQLTQDLYQASLVNNTVKTATVGPSSVTLKESSAALQMSPKVLLLIAPYRDYAKTILR